jgi:DNA-binding transcriptional ArsR family regulator
MAAIKSINDPRYVKAMSHPVRVRAMAMLTERQASPNELAAWLGTTLGGTAYHVRELHRLGLIELVDEVRRRGAVEHYYRATALPSVTAESWSTASPVAKQATIGARLKMVENHTNASAAAGGFDRGDAVLERTTVTLDEKGWTALVAEAAKFVERVDRIESDAAKRLAKTAGNDAIDAGIVLLGFEAAALADQIPKKRRPDKPMRRISRSGTR